MQKFNELRKKGAIFSKNKIVKRVKVENKPYHYIEYIETVDDDKLYKNIEILKSKIVEEGSVEIIDKVRLKIDTETKLYKVFLEDHHFNENEIFACPHILDGIDRSQIFGEGLISILSLNYDSTKKKFVIEDIKNLPTIVNLSMENWVSLRKEMTTHEWLDFILTSLGYNPNSLTPYEKIFYIVRLIPFYVGNYNLIELGEPGTGKSTLYENYYKSSMTKKGSITEPALFGDLKDKKDGRPGHIHTHSIIAFDEVAEMQMDKNLPSILLGYMANGVAGREGESKNSTASLVFLGNLKKSQIEIYKNDSPADIDLFENFPKEIKFDSFKDRIQYFIPGWQIRSDKSSFHENVGDGISVECFFKTLKNLRTVSFMKEINEYTELPGMESRDKSSIESTLQGLLRILHPHKEITDKEMNFYIQIAHLGRNIVSQQKEINKFEYTPLYDKDSYNEWIINSLCGLLKEYHINDIEEAYIDKNRLLIKPFSQNFFYKIGLNRLGVDLNTQEYKLYQSFEKNNSEFLKNICRVEIVHEDFLILKQEYCKPCSCKNEVRDLDIGIKEDIFNLTGIIQDKNLLKILEPNFKKIEGIISEKDREIRELSNKVNDLDKNLHEMTVLLQDHLRQIKLDQLNFRYWLNKGLGYGLEIIDQTSDFLIFNEEKSDISEIIEIISKDYTLDQGLLDKSDYGYKNNYLKIINFAHFLDFFKNEVGKHV